MSETFHDSDPPMDAPRAGGCIVKPVPPTRSSDDWECWLTLEKGICDASQASRMATCTSGEGETTHIGGCHCGKVRFSCQTPFNSEIILWDCNCSDCRLRRNVHFIIPKEKFQILQGINNLAIYRWGTGQAIHQFCSTCGITPFYIPRSNPDGIAITFACLDSASSTIQNVTLRRFDGRNWEKFILKEGKDIKQLSKKNCK